ncbi:PIN domain-containing protein [Ideonella azotifigens]|uniref:PIN domain-containing protein n=1 Tax=Ideonella azotifigens TaxID=513160 RepID=A0ABN1K2Y6_9BURK|nr:PIN domain-containing protein [Ideonella azotifigens]MCD2344596.1 PIN domain-containing protein [Ideonella azotifigens]
MIPVVADADTLFGATTRGLLIHLDYRGAIRLHWSPLILDELSRALVDTGRKPDLASARRHEALMRTALPEAEIATAQVQAQFSAVATAMRSAKDIHVAACAQAVRIGLSGLDAPVVHLVTHNLRDFGIRKLSALGIKVMRPDVFLTALFEQSPRELASAFASLRATLRSAPTPELLLSRLAADGQSQAAAALLKRWQQDDFAL